MRQYRLKILQTQEHDNFENYLLDLLNGGDKCWQLVVSPRKKSDRNIAKKGIKWIDGVINLVPNENCYRDFFDHIDDEHFHLNIIRMN